MQVTDRDDDDDEVDVNCDQETRVPPSTPIHTVRPKNAAYAFPGMQVNAVLAAGSMKAAVSPSGTFSSFSASSAPTKPAVSFADERAPSHDRKRSRRALQDDSAIEDIMSQITMKINSLSTESTSYPQESILAFLEVLGCAHHEAEFYLESTNWDIQTAVVLYLENNPLPTFSSIASSSVPAATMSAFQEDFYSVATKAADTKFQWRDREVEIVGLDPAWEARVNPYDGTVYFRSRVNGVTQKQVPVGFADVSDDLMQSSIPSSPDHSTAASRMDEADGASLSQSVSTNFTSGALCGSVNSLENRRGGFPAANGATSTSTSTSSASSQTGGSAFAQQPAYTDPSSSRLDHDGSFYPYYAASEEQEQYHAEQSRGTMDEESPVGDGPGMATSQLEGSGEQFKQYSFSSPASRPMNGPPRLDEDEDEL